MDSSRLFQSVFENLQDGISILDAELNILKVNRWVERTFASRMPLVGRKCYELYQRRKSPCPWCPSLKTLETGDSFTETVPYSLESGQVGWWHVTTYPLLDSEGNMSGVIEHVKDVTDLVATRETSREARQKAEDANRLKSEFLARVGRDLRIPMNNIFGMTYLLRQTELTLSQEEYVEELEDASGRLREVISDFFDISKMETQGSAVESRVFDLDSVLANIVEKAAETARNKGIGFTCSKGRCVPSRLLGDPVWLHQILLHLTNNAIKFTDTGEIAVSVGPTKKDHHRVSLVFSVRDTGIGLSPSEIDALFRSFGRIDGAVDREYEGAGLGLPVCRRVLQMMGSELSIKSEPGQGSTFSFILAFDYLKEGDESSMEEPAQRNPASVDASIAAPRLKELACMLRRKDLNSERVFREIERMTNAALPGETKAVKAGLDTMDFDAALLGLERMAEFLCITLEGEDRDHSQ